MAESRPPKPWLLIVAGVLLACLLGYALLAGWLPARHRIARLEAEMREVYAREAALQSRLAQEEQLRRQLDALQSERDALARRVEQLERELAGALARRR